MSRKNIEVPNLIKECRSINELIYRIEARAHNNNTSLYEDIYEISEAFNPFIDEIELQNIEIKIINIECEVPQKLNYNDILDYINKCDARIKMEIILVQLQQLKPLSRESVKK